MTSADVITTVITVGAIQLVGSAVGFGVLIQTVRGHGDRIDRLEEHEDANRAAWPSRPHSSGNR